MSRNKRVRIQDLLVVESPAMQAAVDGIESLVDSDEAVLIEGEPGTGRELIARYLHQYGKRASAELVALKAGDMPSELFEGEDGEPHFRCDARGTLLVKDICELRRQGQRRLSAVLGAQQTGMRFVATTDPGLDDAVAAGVFYAPLYSKISTHTIKLPALRNRREDIVPLMERLVRAVARDMGRRGVTISTRANDRLCSYRWPGNVSEMKQVARRLVVRAKGKKIEASDVDRALPVLAERVPLEQVAFEDLGRSKLSAVLRRLDGYPIDSLYDDVMGRVEGPLLALVMEHTGNNQFRAAEILGLNRNTLRKKLTEHGIIEPRARMKRAAPRTAAARKKSTR